MGLYPSLGMSMMMGIAASATKTGIFAERSPNSRVKAGTKTLRGSYGKPKVWEPRLSYRPQRPMRWLLRR